ncbi:hypothetical protein I302_108720 [Kwoniella bestiolae CBS 10118]|uniref:Uncharacterized protein n=1 Tax=Kwoniella bestiolae CBS 10118 TaxID=1296100 RepID=A0A1B9FTX5_9TREE|nr:hypothetical protein I302_07857 [Kwoniella bestiolae CBS 10118]OCF22212.1 hypothetical protein I302_07857 [Kwoniella bestiolae CBS 10118]
MYLKDERTVTTNVMMPRATWNSTGLGMSTPLKIFIPIFATFMAIIFLTLIIRVARKADLHRRFNQSKPPPTMEYTRPTNITPSQPFEIDPPHVTPYPAPTTTDMRQHDSHPVIQDIPVSYQPFNSGTRMYTAHDIHRQGMSGSESERGSVMPPSYEEVLRGQR